MPVSQALIQRGSWGPLADCSTTNINKQIFLLSLTYKTAKFRYENNKSKSPRSITLSTNNSQQQVLCSQGPQVRHARVMYCAGEGAGSSPHQLVVHPPSYVAGGPSRELTSEALPIYLYYCFFQLYCVILGLPTKLIFSLILYKSF